MAVEAVTVLAEILSEICFHITTEKNTVNTMFFFSGFQQQDAHECFLMFVDIMHQGSKYSVLDPQENGTEDGMVSLHNNIFYSVCQRKICCEICNNMINISPQNSCS